MKRETGSVTRAHISTLDSARHRSGDACIQPVALRQSSSVTQSFDYYTHAQTLVQHMWDSLDFCCFVLSTKSASVDSIVSVGVPLDAWLNPGAVLC